MKMLVGMTWNDHDHDHYHVDSLVHHEETMVDPFRLKPLVKQAGCYGIKTIQKQWHRNGIPGQPQPRHALSTAHPRHRRPRGVTLGSSVIRRGQLKLKQLLVESSLVRGL